MNKIIKFLMVGIFLVNTVGCVAVVAGTAGGAGTAVWLSGKLTQEVHVSREKAVKAARSALKSLKLEITKETKTEEVTQIKSNYTDGREIWIDIRPMTESSTKIEVRVGAIGDKAAADKILKKIASYL